MLFVLSGANADQSIANLCTRLNAEVAAFGIGHCMLMALMVSMSPAVTIISIEEQSN